MQLKQPLLRTCLAICYYQLTSASPAVVASDSGLTIPSNAIPVPGTFLQFKVVILPDAAPLDAFAERNLLYQFSAKLQDSSATSLQSLESTERDGLIVDIFPSRIPGSTPITYSEAAKVIDGLRAYVASKRLYNSITYYVYDQGTEQQQAEGRIDPSSENTTAHDRLSGDSKQKPKPVAVNKRMRKTRAVPNDPPANELPPQYIEDANLSVHTGKLLLTNLTIPTTPLKASLYKLLPSQHLNPVDTHTLYARLATWLSVQPAHDPLGVEGKSFNGPGGLRVGMVGYGASAGDGDGGGVVGGGEGGQVTRRESGQSEEREGGQFRNTGVETEGVLTYGDAGRVVWEVLRFVRDKGVWRAVVWEVRSGDVSVGRGEVVVVGNGVG